MCAGDVDELDISNKKDNAWAVYVAGAIYWIIFAALLLLRFYSVRRSRIANGDGCYELMDLNTGESVD